MHEEGGDHENGTVSTISKTTFTYTYLLMTDFLLITNFTVPTIRKT
jgi:hypothetical protein